jgi:hypothetical protein
VELEDNEKLQRTWRKVYDWKAYTPEGRALMEDYWSTFVEGGLARFLPENLQRDRHQHRGINLGTFNGSYQKAWMRAGYPMYGVELADSIDELHEYGCEGHQDNFFDMLSIDEESFDFAVLDRSICTKGFYDYYDRRFEEPDSRPGGLGQIPRLFDRIFRIIRPGGALIGILYAHYTETITGELARRGSMTIWPVSQGCLAFRVVKDHQLTHFPRPEDEDLLLSQYVKGFQPVPGGWRAAYMPTNELITVMADGERRSEFLPMVPDLGRLRL